MKRGNTALKRGVGLASAFALAIAGAVIAAPAANAATVTGATFDDLIRTLPTADAKLFDASGNLVEKGSDIGAAGTTYAATTTGALPVVGVGSAQDVAGIQLFVPGANAPVANDPHWAVNDTFKIQLSNEATWSAASVAISATPVTQASLAGAVGVANSAKYLGETTATAGAAGDKTLYNDGAIDLKSQQNGTVTISTDGDTATVKFVKADQNPVKATEDASAEGYLITISGVKVNVSNRAQAAPITASVVGAGAGAGTTTIGYVMPYTVSIPDGEGYPANSSDPLALPTVTVKETSVNGFDGQNFLLSLSGDEAVTGTPAKFTTAPATWTPTGWLEVDGNTAGDKATVTLGAAAVSTDATLQGTGTPRIDTASVAGLKIQGLKAGTDATVTLVAGTGLTEADASAWASSPDQDVTNGPSVKIGEVVEAPRISGTNRYDTAAKIAAKYAGDDPLTAVILANGTDTKLGIDALSANFLAGDVDAPILLTDAGKTLPSQTADALKSLFKDSAGNTDGEINIYVMGAEVDSVSKEAADQAKQIVTDAANSGVSKVNIVRLAGSDRFDTAAKAAQQGSDSLGAVNLGSGNYNTAFLASGLVNADALAAGAISASAGFPVLLTNGSVIGDSTAKAISDLNIQQLVVLGGPDRVSDELVAKLKADNGIKNVVRIAGSGAYGRYNTAALLNDWAFSSAGLSQGAGVFLASGFADALAAGPYVGQTAGTPNVMLTIPGTMIPDLTKQTLKGLSSVTSVTALGGTDRVSDSVVVEAQKLVLS